MPSAWTLEILPGYFLDRPLRRNRPVNNGNCNVNAESVPVSRLYARADAHAAARRATTPGPAPAAPALLANEAGLDPSLSFPVVVGNVVRTITPVPVYLARIILLAAAIARLDGVTFPEFVRRPAIGVAASAAERRDEARLDARLGFAVIVCV